MGYDVRAWVDGEWLESADGEQTNNLNPADSQEVLGTAPRLGWEATLRAIAAAERALPAWRSTPAPERAQCLSRAKLLLQARKDEVARALTLEEGKIFAEAQGEVQKAINVLEFVAGEGRRLGGHTVPSEMRRTLAYTVRQPLGVVGIITPWNFPVAIPLWKIAPALVCGNTVVFKPASLTPWTAELITGILVEAGVPAGVLNMVTGSGTAVGDILVHDPRVRALSFTGSNAVGLALYSAAAARGARVQCEMGGKNPLMVLADANIEQAALAAAQGAFGSTGQRCTATSRAIVHEAVADAFAEAVVGHANRMVLGAGMDARTTLGPLVDASAMRSVLSYVEVGQQEGAKLVCGGQQRTEGSLARGYFVAPTVFDHVQPQHRIAQEEIFGPVLSILRVPNFETGLRVANDSAYGLSSSVYGTDMREIMRFVDGIETGITHVNSPTMGGEAQMPFGGSKSTSVGHREMGSTAVEFYSEIKSVYIDYSGEARTSKVY